MPGASCPSPVALLTCSGKNKPKTTFHFPNDVSKEAIAICTLNTQQNAETGVQYKSSNAPVATFTPTFKEALFAHPNPVQNTLYVHFTNSTGSPFQLKLINIQGRPILEQTVEASAAEQDISIPVDHLAPGIYTLILQRDGVSVGRVKVVKI